MRKRRIYAAVFVLLLALEICIALFVRDSYIRPYGGDILVTVLICCFIRIIFPKGIKLLPIWVFLFALFVEIAQYFDYAFLLFRTENIVLRVILGSTFSLADVLCYALGCGIFAIADNINLRRSNDYDIKDDPIK